jgi:ABC-type multidrug transport system permease subunit
MRPISLIALQTIKLLCKTPYVVALLLFAPLGLIFVFGQAFEGIFAASGQGLRAIDYFGPTMLTLSIFQGTFVATWAVAKERKSGASVRLSISPIAPIAPAFGAFAGSLAALISLGCAVAILATLALSARLGPDPLSTFAAIAAESCLAAALGTSLASIIRDERASNGIVNSAVPILIFLGGGYFRLPDSGFLYELSFVSPIRWINLSLLPASVGGSLEYLGFGIAFCLATAAALLALTAALRRRPA